jgi:hypothetical protein
MIINDATFIISTGTRNGHNFLTRRKTWKLY